MLASLIRERYNVVIHNSSRTLLMVVMVICGPSYEALWWDMLRKECSNDVNELAKFCVDIQLHVRLANTSKHHMTLQAKKQPLK